jgi:hypothetical protein
VNCTRSLAAAVVAAFLCLSVESRADVVGTFGPVTIEASHVPTLALAGYSTWTLSASSGISLQSFDFAGSDAAGPFGFFGAMNHNNPANQLTIFPDVYAAIFPSHPYFEQDSHFSYGSFNLNVSPGTSSESATTLRSAFAGKNPFTSPTPFVQLVIADGNHVDFRGTVGFATAAGQDLVAVFGQIGVPEPASVVLMCTALLSVVRPTRNRRRHCV